MVWQGGEKAAAHGGIESRHKWANLSRSVRVRPPNPTELVAVPNKPHDFLSHLEPDPASAVRT